jgi:energy-converting hydrogenase A subunit R
MRKTQFVSDLEGPLTLNDNAFELTAHFLPQGAHFFALMSRYDDILADIVKRSGYRAGTTLALIVPFLKAFGLRDRDLHEFSRSSIRLVPGALEALQRIRAQMPAFIISTSYEPYVRAVCEALQFPFENAYCTKISLDAYALSEEERQELLTLYDQIVQRKEIPPGVQSVDELSGEDRQTIALLDHIFWERVWGMEIGCVLREVQPIGGPEKARALHEISERTGISLAQTIYVGDSITDVEALALVRQAGGLGGGVQRESLCAQGC